MTSNVKTADSPKLDRRWVRLAKAGELLRRLYCYATHDEIRGEIERRVEDLTELGV